MVPSKSQIEAFRLALATGDVGAAMSRAGDVGYERDRLQWLEGLCELAVRGLALDAEIVRRPRISQEDARSFDRVVRRAPPHSPEDELGYTRVRNLLRAHGEGAWPREPG